MNRWSVAIGVIAQLVVASACASKANQGGGSETGFLACDVDSDCGTGSCVEAKCADDEGRNMLAASHEPTGTCDDPLNFSQSMPGWWQAEWTPNMQTETAPTCGFPNNPEAAPAVVGRWMAPSGGTYLASGWSRDMNAVFSGALECGAPKDCAMLEPQGVPDAPFAPTIVRPGGGFTFEAEAGSIVYFSFQFLDLHGGSPPERGTVIANITTRPW
jgi:hypothetical protein